MLDRPFRYVLVYVLIKKYSRKVLQISRVKANLDIFPTKDDKLSEFYPQIKNILHFLVKDGCIVVKFYLILVNMCVHFSDFQFVGGD